MIGESEAERVGSRRDVRGHIILPLGSPARPDGLAPRCRCVRRIAGDTNMAIPTSALWNARSNAAHVIPHGTRMVRIHEDLLADGIAFHMLAPWRDGL
jgi:hypothetical protein